MTTVSGGSVLGPGGLGNPCRDLVSSGAVESKESRVGACGLEMAVPAVAL